MKKRPVWLYSIIGIVIAVVLIVVFGLHAFKGVMIKRYFARMQAPVVTVSMVAAKKVAWTPYVEAIGSLEAVKGVEISNALAGTVTDISFHSGEQVEQGKLLAQLDISQEQALLEQYRAQEKLNKLNYERALNLRKRNLNSKQDLDNARTQYKVSQAQVAQEEAVIAKKTVRAPFSGLVGIRQVNLGQYLQPGTAIVRLEQVSPLHVNFTLPQADIARIRKGLVIEAHANAYPGQVFTGTINAVSPAVSAQSRTLQVQGILDNRDAKLKPGMYVDLRVMMPKAAIYTVVPITAITYSLYGDSVYVLTPEKQVAKNKSGPPPSGTMTKTGTSQSSSASTKPVYVARQVYVKPGESRGNWIAVTGIKPGTEVVTAGQIKLHNGSRVVINNRENPVNTPKELTP